MTAPHKPSCAKRLRERALAEQQSTRHTVRAIVDCCSVSLLRAHRLARGWTLRAAVDAYLLMVADEPRAARVDQEQLRVWETDPTRWPRARTIDLLCRLYQTAPGELGFPTGDYRAAPGAALDPPRPLPVPHTRPRDRDNTRTIPTTAGTFDDLLDRARRSVDRTLATATVSPAQLDLLDERLLWLRTQYLVTAPLPMLGLLLPELDEVQLLAAERQPATAQMRLSEMTAVLATLTADALMKLGKLRQSRAWYATARAAADDSVNVELRARVRAQAAMLPYYYGPLASAAGLAREARMLSRHKPTVTGAFAAAAEARALARQGDTAGAETAIRTAQADFERCDHGDAEDAFAFPQRRLLLYLSGAWTFLGRTRQARQVQQEALALYAGHSGIDPALIRLEEAICLAREHHLSDACQLAAATYAQVPEDHRTLLIGERARDVLNVIPTAMRTTRPARELGEILALTAGAR
ncbi:hypothetical protein [Streptomyces jumonjinensis]|uniref:hypothetical protein n=1 Tax=Streptomyces jumonjinensis TaxID=1945 RepID=UPI0037978737